jgi:DNA-3-methyladenine glycosylase I
MNMTREPKRCGWCAGHDLHIEYHDAEWGVPVHDDRHLFEMLNLEGAQAGVSWLVVLKKRPHYQKVFANFEAEKVVRFTDKKLEKLLLDPGIIRNRLKVFGVRENARAFLEVQSEYGSFNDYIWQFVDGKPIVNKWKTSKQVPGKTEVSDTMSKDLKKRGFKFIGSTICYAFMQGVGMVNDHTTDCFRYKQV